MGRKEPVKDRKMICSKSKQLRLVGTGALVNAVNNYLLIIFCLDVVLNRLPMPGGGRQARLPLRRDLSPKLECCILDLDLQVLRTVNASFT